MSKRVIGYVLIAAAIVGLIAAFGSVPLTRVGTGTPVTMLSPFERYGFLGGLSRARTFGDLPLNIVVTILAGVGLVGAGLLIFGGKANKPPAK